MTLVVAIFGLLIALLGGAGVVSPPWLLGLVGRLQTRSGLFFMAAVRLLLGVALIFAATDSRAPDLLAVLGVVTIVAGVATPFFGLRRFEALLGWWRERPPPLVRLWCGLVTLLGACLVWAVFPGAAA